MAEAIDADLSLEEKIELDEEEELAEAGESDYEPDPRLVWGAEGMRALVVVLARRFGPDFARELHNELASRTFAYEAGCPDDRRDAGVMQSLLDDAFWDRLFTDKSGEE